MPQALSTFLKRLAVIAAMAFAFLPIFWLFSTSVKPYDEWAAWPPVWITEQPTLQNYRIVFFPAAAREFAAGQAGSLDYKVSGSAWKAFEDSAIISTCATFFSILFGTRHIDASEHHEGMVAAIAFESIVKLLAFLAVGIFVTFGLYGGFGDLFAKAAARPDLAKLFVVDSGAYGQWITLTVLSMAAIICLPRQFQVTVVENVDEDHLRKAVWLFPLYLLAINIFVLPIAFAGMMQFPGGNVDADTFVLTVPMAAKQEGLALFAYIGGLSAATAMVIVATIALSTMVCNDLVMPVLLRLTWLRLTERGDLSQLLLAIRRGSIILIVLLGYGYFHYIGESYALV